MMANASRLTVCSLLRTVMFKPSNFSQMQAPTRLALRLAHTNSQTETENVADQNSTDQPAVSPTEKLEADFKAEKEQLLSQISDFKDKYQRSLAETENVRQRLKKQIDDAKLFGIQGFSKDLLEVADIMEKATDSVPQDALNSNPHLSNLYQGLQMTETQLLKVFTKNGITQIDPAQGEEFDPNRHEAMFQANVVEDFKPGTIAVVTKIGYTLHSRTLRPALVGVYKDA